AARITGLCPRLHVTGGAAQGEEQTIQVYLKHPSPLFRRQLLKATATAHACVGKAAVHSTEYRERFRKGTLDGCFIGNVALDRVHLRTKLLQLLECLMILSLVLATDADITALPGNSLRKPQSDATIAASDQRGLAAEVKKIGSHKLSIAVVLTIAVRRLPSGQPQHVAPIPVR